MEDTAEIDIKHGLPVVSAHVESRRIAHNTGIVDQNINRTMLRIDCFHDIRDHRGFCDVERDECSRTSGPDDRIDDNVALRLIQVGDDDTGTSIGQPFGDRPADAARCPVTTAVLPSRRKSASPMSCTSLFENRFQRRIEYPVLLIEFVVECHFARLRLNAFARAHPTSRTFSKAISYCSLRALRR